MKRASLLMMLLISLFVFVAPATAQERSWRIHGVGIGVKVQNPIRSSPRVRVDATYPSGASSTQRANSANTAAREEQWPSQEQDLAEIQRRTSAVSETRVGGSVIIPPGTKHTAPNFNGVLIGLSFEGAYDKDIAAKVQEEAGKRGAYFTDSCDPRPIACLVVHNPTGPAGTFSSDGSGSWNGERSSNWGSSSEAGNIYGVTLSAHLLANGQSDYLGDKSDGFKAVTHSSQYSANSNHGNRGGNASQGGSTMTINQDLAVHAGAAKKVRGMIGSFLKDKKKWRPGAAQFVREAFNQQ